MEQWRPESIGGAKLGLPQAFEQIERGTDCKFLPGAVPRQFNQFDSSTDAALGCLCPWMFTADREVLLDRNDLTALHNPHEDVPVHSEVEVRQQPSHVFNNLARKETRRLKKVIDA